MQSAFDLGPIPPPRGVGWVRSDGVAGHKTCGARHTMMLDGKPTGYVIKHCGHPTANYPYTLHTPDGRTILQGGEGLGFAFRLLADAKVAAIADREARS